MEVRLDEQRPGHWSTDGVDQRRALAYWVDTVCDRFLELDIDTPVRSHFRACLDQIDFGPATLSFVGAASQRIRRTPAKISRTRYPAFFLVQFRVGHGILRQRGKELQAHAGECVLVDGTEPYDLDCPQCHVGGDFAHAGGLAAALAAKSRISSPTLFSRGDWSSALCAAMSSLRLETCSDLALPRSTVAEQIASLLTLAVGQGRRWRMPAHSAERPDRHLA